MMTICACEWCRSGRCLCRGAATMIRLRKPGSSRAAPAPAVEMPPPPPALIQPNPATMGPILITGKSASSEYCEGGLPELGNRLCCEVLLGTMLCPSCAVKPLMYIWPTYFTMTTGCVSSCFCFFRCTAHVNIAAGGQYIYWACVRPCNHFFSGHLGQHDSLKKPLYSSIWLRGRPEPSVATHGPCVAPGWWGVRSDPYKLPLKLLSMTCCKVYFTQSWHTFT